MSTELNNYCVNLNSINRDISVNFPPCASEGIESAHITNGLLAPHPTCNQEFSPIPDNVYFITDGLPKMSTSQVSDLLKPVGAALSILIVGTETGAPIPLPDGGFLRDDSDQIVIPAVDKRMIQQIASNLDARSASVSVDSSDLTYLLSGTESSMTSDDSL